jgi:uncharacterized protein involved in tolerance to divalent cations
LTDEEIRAAVKIGGNYRIFDLLKNHFARKVQLIDEEIRACVKRIIKTDNVFFWNFKLLKAHFDQEIQLTDEEIRTSVKKIIIEKKHDYRISVLLKAHFDQSIRLTDEEVGGIVGKLSFEFTLGHTKQLVKDDFPKLSQMQIVAFAKGTAPKKMAFFLVNNSQKLDSNRFRWIVEVSSPLCICSFWKACPPTMYMAD